MLSRCWPSWVSCETKGVLTDREFADKKADILKRL